MVKLGIGSREGISQDWLARQQLSSSSEVSAVSVSTADFKQALVIVNRVSCKSLRLIGVCAALAGLGTGCGLMSSVPAVRDSFCSLESL